MTTIVRIGKLTGLKPGTPCAHYGCKNRPVWRYGTRRPTAFYYVCHVHKPSLS